MTRFNRFCLHVSACFMATMFALAQGLPIANVTSEQRATLAQIDADLAPLQNRLTKARAAVIQASLALPRNDTSIHAAVDAAKAAEQELANARVEAFARIQSSAQRLSSEQLAALSASAVRGGGRGAVGATESIPHLTPAQGNALFETTNGLRQLTSNLASARAAVIAASLAQPPDKAAPKANVDAVAAAELRLAVARANAFAKLQSSANKLDNAQVAAFAASGATFGQIFTQPEPLDFNDHRGYVPLFDGVSLKGWDGNPKFWRVENGAIVGQSTPDNPSGNTYLVYRGVEAHDFTLKCEIKVEGSGGSGIQYRSREGIPWMRPIPANVTANVGPVNLRWMQTGLQADFWPSQIYSGQVYSENSPMGIMAWRGQVVEGAGLGSRRLMGTIGDLKALGAVVRQNDWNEYTVIARGPTVMHIINGQLMAVLIDDDPGSSDNWTGQFGIELEALAKVSVRNIWLKKLN